MELVLLEAPTSPVITIEEAKTWLRVSFADEDANIAALIAAATARFDGRDGVLGRCLAPQTWQARMARFPGVIVLPLPPTIHVEAIEYVDPDDVVQTLEPAAYEVVAGGWRAARVQPAHGAAWPATKAGALDAVRVTFRAGYVTSGSPSAVVVPEPIKLAMLMLIADWYDASRGNVVIGASVAAMPFATEALIAPFRAVPLV